MKKKAKKRAKGPAIPKDWHGPMKACAAVLKREGVKTRWNSQLVKQLMLWGFKSLLFYEINHGELKKQREGKMPKSHWNYRVFEEKFPGESVFSIRDVYYRNGRPRSFGSEPQPAQGEDRKALLSDMQLMVEAFKKPIIVIKDGRFL